MWYGKNVAESLDTQLLVENGIMENPMAFNNLIFPIYFNAIDW